MARNLALLGRLIFNGLCSLFLQVLLPVANHPTCDMLGPRLISHAPTSPKLICQRIYRAQERPGRLRLPVQGCRPQAHVCANHAAFANRHSARRGARGNAKHKDIGGGQTQGSQGETARRIQGCERGNGRPYDRRKPGRFRNRPIVPDSRHFHRWCAGTPAGGVLVDGECELSSGMYPRGKTRFQ